MPLVLCLGFFLNLPLGLALTVEKSTLNFRTHDGTLIQATIHRYEKNKNKGRSQTSKLPVLMVFGGFKYADQVLTLPSPKLPIALMSFPYPFDPPKKPFQFPGSLKLLPDAKKTIWNTLWGIDALIEVLHQEKSDSYHLDQITLLGASFGAPFVTYALTRNPKIKAAIIVQGFGRLKETLQSQISEKIKPSLGMFSTPISWFLVQLGWAYVGLPHLETEVRSLRASKKVLMLQAEEDSFLSKHSQRSLQRAFEDSEAQFTSEWLPGKHLAPGADQQIETLTKRVTHWLQNHQLLRE